MTGTNQFNDRSDNAALKLKGELNNRNRGNPDWSPLESAPVAVGPDGQPPQPPPPEGSYARAAWDQQQQQLRAEAAAAAQQAQSAMGQPTQQQIVGQQPPAGTPDQQADGSVAPPLTTGQPQSAAPVEQPPTQPISENANTRIQGLIAELREKDRQIAELAGAKGELDQVRDQVSVLTEERDNFVRQHLDEMDPEQRAAVLAEGRFREMLAANNRALMEQLQPTLSTLQQQNQQTEFDRLAAKYPGFDLQLHPALIDQLRAKVPQLTVEMAFKAVAEGDEAVTREQAAQVAVPPVVPAGNGAPLPRYMPEPTPDPTDELRAFQQRTNQLVASTDPAEQRQGYRNMDQAIKARLSGASYEGKPSVFD